MLYAPTERHFLAPPGRDLALPGGVGSPAPPPSRFREPLICSLALHGLILAVAIWLTLPQRSHTPLPEMFISVQFAAAPLSPLPVSAAVPAPQPAPPEPPAQQSSAEPEPEPPPPARAAEIALPRPKPVVKTKAPETKPLPKPRAVPPKPQVVQQRESPPLQSAEAAPMQSPAPVTADAPPAPMQSPAGMPSAQVPAAANMPAAAPGETISNEPPVLHTARFRRPPAPPNYPPRARQMEQEGVSVVRALIDTDGASREVMLWRSSGYQMLDQAALAAVRGWAFEAARLGEKPILAWVEIPVRFQMR